jgi:hypothetical protein
MSGIARGLYEELLTSAMERRLTTLDSAEATVAPVDPADQPHVLARHVGGRFAVCSQRQRIRSAVLPSSTIS